MAFQKTGAPEQGGVVFDTSPKDEAPDVELVEQDDEGKEERLEDVARKEQ